MLSKYMIKMLVNICIYILNESTRVKGIRNLEHGVQVITLSEKTPTVPDNGTCTAHASKFEFIWALLNVHFILVYVFRLAKPSQPQLHVCFQHCHSTCDKSQAVVHILQYNQQNGWTIGEKLVEPVRETPISHALRGGQVSYISSLRVYTEHHTHRHNDYSSLHNQQTFQAREHPHLAASMCSAKYPLAHTYTI